MTTRQAKELRDNELGRFLDEITVDLHGNQTAQNFLKELYYMVANPTDGANGISLQFKPGSHRSMHAFTRYIIQDDRFATENFRVFDLSDSAESPMGEIIAYDPKSLQTKVNIVIGNDNDFQRKLRRGEDSEANINIHFIEVY